MRDEKPGKRKESSLVIAARYSEIGFMVPAAVFVGYLLGLGADHLLHTHWIYIFGIFLGAVAGFMAMIRRALRANEDGDDEKRDRSNDGR
jgi:F0F1-type ATP synthase assembly protein I